MGDSISAGIDPRMFLFEYIKNPYKGIINIRKEYNEKILRVLYLIIHFIVLATVLLAFLPKDSASYLFAQSIPLLGILICGCLLIYLDLKKEIQINQCVHTGRRLMQRALIQGIEMDEQIIVWGTYEIALEKEPGFKDLFKLLALVKRYDQNLFCELFEKTLLEKNLV